ncbi:putative glycosyltransferase EpsJ [Peptoclostridium acidaminophilum DSM 3953]|uniref:Putative glycosyltransferase EpsJ n=1 Tax=Peptoclostridium acidaminophilum DSM 3953 TaxID=1286171 RepID=W8TH97_PEPAC|nr:glycosyltransferase [Peptoclostridium acidaminophilum]AHM57188.1 putative glycosyltransferase EpsJ [Peptoclostridium acidaminophilum DSM 3953]
MDPLISVIIPVYNAEGYIRKCLDSVIGQSYENLEIIVIDDGSTDESGNICDEYGKKDARIRVLHKGNGGVSTARNLGLKMATGKYVGFVDSDDWIEKDMYSFLVSMAEANDADVAACGYYINDDSPPMQDNECATQSMSQEAAIQTSFLNVSRFCFYGALWNKLFRSDIFKGNGIEFDESISVGEDMLFLSQCIMGSGKIVYSPIPKYHYACNEMGVTSKPFYSQKVSMLKALDKIESIVTPKYPQLAPVVHQRSIQTSCNYLRQAMYNKSFNDYEAIRRLRDNIKKGFVGVVMGSDLSLKDKIKLMLFSTSPKIYRQINSKYKAVGAVLKREK